MTTKLDVGSEFAAVADQLDAVERGDMNAVRDTFAAGARIWHNYDEVDQDVDQVIALLSGLCSVSTNRTYEDRRVTTFGNVAFIQHTLTADLDSGETFRMPAMMRFQINPDDGLIERVDEYLDSRTLVPLQSSLLRPS